MHATRHWSLGAKLTLVGVPFLLLVLRTSSDEFGTQADGFNGMAEHLQSMYKHLEAKVAEKTAELQDKTERLASLYQVTALVANATSLETLAQQFAQHVARIARAHGMVLRWSSQGNLRHLMLAAHGLPRQCAKAGFETLITIPVRLQERVMGEVDLFFHARISPSEAEISLLEVLCTHLASGMENLRLHALEKEAAVLQERHLLARELLLHFRTRIFGISHIPDAAGVMQHTLKNPGVFIAPVMIGAQIKAGTPQTAMYGFAIFYALCLVLNWWFYLRSGSEIKNP